MKYGSLVKPESQNNIYFVIFFAMVWSKEILIRYARAIMLQLPFVSTYVDELITGAMVLFFLLSIHSFFQRVYVRDLVLLMCVYLIFYLYYALYKDNRIYFYQSTREITRQVFPMYLLGACMRYSDNEDLIQLIYKLGMISVVAFCVYTLFMRSMGEFMRSAGDMHGSYSLLPHVCFTYGAVMQKPRPHNIAIFAMGTLMLLFLGTRGTIVCLGVCVILMTLSCNRLKHPVLFILLGVLVMVVLLAFGILDFLSGLAEELNLSVRIFNKIENDALTSTSGRDNLQGSTWEHIWQSPIIGKGIFSDRFILDGMYVHNVVIELLIHFGFCGAIPLLIIVCMRLFRSYFILKYENDPAQLLFFLGLISCTAVKLMVSSSYLLERNLYLLLGFCSAVCRGKPSLSRLRREAKESTPRRKLRR